MSGNLVADTVAAETLGTALRRGGYSEDAVYRLLGDEAYSSERGDIPADERRLPETPLATLVRLFFLQLPVTADEAEVALGRSGIDALEATGLAEVGDDVIPRARLLPIGKLLLASDGFSRDADDPADYVATYTPTARVLDSLTPRPRVERALDVGTGSGIHALLAAQHAGQVIATDVNPRALAYTTLNAALERAPQCRVPPGKPVRARGGRDLRAHHLQRPLRHLARDALGVSRQRVLRGRGVGARAALRSRASRRRWLRGHARELACVRRERTRRARDRLGGGERLRQLDPLDPELRSADARRGVELAPGRRGPRRRARRVGALLRRPRGRARERRGRHPPQASRWWT